MAGERHHPIQHGSASRHCPPFPPLPCCLCVRVAHTLRSGSLRWLARNAHSVPIVKRGAPLFSPSRLALSSAVPPSSSGSSSSTGGAAPPSRPTPPRSGVCRRPSRRPPHPRGLQVGNAGRGGGRARLPARHGVCTSVRAFPPAPQARATNAAAAGAPAGAMWRGAAAMGRGAAAVALLGYLVAGAAAAEGTSAPLGEWFWVGWLPAAWPLGHPVISAAGWMGGWMGGWAGRRVVRARAQREGPAGALRVANPPPPPPPHRYRRYTSPLLPPHRQRPHGGRAAHPLGRRAHVRHGGRRLLHRPLCLCLRVLHPARRQLHRLPGHALRRNARHGGLHAAAGVHQRHG